MVEANPSLAPSRAQRQAERMRIAVRVKAQRRAREEVKAQIRSEGRVKLASVPPREITAMAEARPRPSEIIAEARARVEQWRVEGFFGKRAALPAHNFRVMHGMERRNDCRLFPREHRWPDALCSTSGAEGHRGR
jgi:hypothetical protein